MISASPMLLGRPDSLINCHSIIRRDQYLPAERRTASAISDMLDVRGKAQERLLEPAAVDALVPGPRSTPHGSVGLLAPRHPADLVVEVVAGEAFLRTTHLAGTAAILRIATEITAGRPATAFAAIIAFANGSTFISIPGPPP